MTDESSRVDALPTLVKLTLGTLLVCLATIGAAHALSALFGVGMPPTTTGLVPSIITTLRTLTQILSTVVGLLVFLTLWQLGF